MICLRCKRPLTSAESIKRGYGRYCQKQSASTGSFTLFTEPLETWTDGKTMKALNALEEAGFEALLVGGAVRDKQLGLIPNDEDVCTNATAEQIEAVLKDKFHSTNLVGKQFGVVIVDGLEVATYRTEEYVVVGKPNVKSAKSYQEDSNRRDFTFNALAQKKDGTIIDHHGGLDDLKNRIVKAIGNPDERFQEDYSRMLRAVYFASRFEFTIEPNTFESIQRNAHHLQHVPPEVIGKIVKKVMKVRKLHTFLPQLRDTGLLPYVFPAIAHTVGKPQNPKYHVKGKDVFNHIMKVTQSAETKGELDYVQTLGGIFHDNAKALPEIRGENKDGQPNDLGHEVAGRQRAEQAILELGYGKEIAKKVGFLVEHHGLRLEPNVKEKSIVKALHKLSAETKNKAELKEKVQMLFSFMEHDANGFNPRFGKKIKDDNHILAQRFQQVLDNHIFYISELPVNGEAVKRYGFQGKEIKEQLDNMVELNIQDVASAEKYLSRHHK